MNNEKNREAKRERETYRQGNSVGAGVCEGEIPGWRIVGPSSILSADCDGLAVALDSTISGFREGVAATEGPASLEGDGEREGVVLAVFLLDPVPVGEGVIVELLDGEVEGVMEGVVDAAVEKELDEVEVRVGALEREAVDVLDRDIVEVVEMEGAKESEMETLGESEMLGERDSEIVGEGE